jgi:hypothetical protein
MSDRWNIAMLGLGLLLPWERNQATLKRLRRVNPDFEFVVCNRRTKYAALPSDAEREALNWHVPQYRKAV